MNNPSINNLTSVHIIDCERLYFIEVSRKRDNASRWPHRPLHQHQHQHQHNPARIKSALTEQDHIEVRVLPTSTMKDRECIRVTQHVILHENIYGFTLHHAHRMKAAAFPDHALLGCTLPPPGNVTETPSHSVIVRLNGSTTGAIAAHGEQD